MEQYVKVPGDRIGAVIGPNGEVKKTLAERTGVDISVDSETGAVAVRSAGDPVIGMRVAEVVKAIARGFSPQRAMRLLDDDDTVLDVINLGNVTSTPRELTRLKGRIIGKDGLMRETIEESTGVFVSVYGKTVALIGGLEGLQVARDAMNMLVDGAPHPVVFSFLARKRGEFRQQGLDTFFPDAEP